MLLCGATIIFCLFDSCCKPCGPLCRVVVGVQLELWNNADSTPVPANNEILAKGLMMTVTLHDSSSNNDRLCKAANHNPFISTAYAMYCDPCNGRDVRSVTSFTITSDDVFDAEHPANESLNDLFYIPKSLENEVSGSYNFYLLKEPDVEGIHRLSITITTSRRDTLIATANPIKLVKQ